MNKAFCAGCGNKLGEGARFCEGCGAQVGQPSQAQEQPLNQNTAHVSSGNKDYSKLGGWLLFFVIINILTTAGALITVMNEITVSVETLQYSSGNISTGLIINIIAQVVTLAGLALAVLWIVQIFQRKILFLLFMQIVSIVMAVSYILSLIAVGIIGFEYIESKVISTIANGLIGSIAGFFLMTLYFCKSIRVRTYMGTDEYMSKAIFAYKQPPLN